MTRLLCAREELYQCEGCGFEFRYAFDRRDHESECGALRSEHCQMCANDRYPADHDPQDCENNGGGILRDDPRWDETR